jgi:hypothetical protein
MKKKTDREQSELEVESLLKQTFGENNIKLEPKVNGNKADFLITDLDIYVEVHAIKDIISDFIIVTPVTENISTYQLKPNAEEKKLDRIALKVLDECSQLPENKQNVLFTKTEGIGVHPDDVIEALVGRKQLVVNKETMETWVQRGKTAVRTEEDLCIVLEKISTIIGYSHVCQHGKLIGVIGQNKVNAKVPLDTETYNHFSEMLCRETTENHA